MNNLNKKRYIQAKIADYYINRDIKNKPNLGDSEITILEREFELINKDGTRKKYLESYRDKLHIKCANISKKLKERNLPYLAKIGRVIGEKGDTRNYISIYIYFNKQVDK